MARATNALLDRASTPRLAVVNLGVLLSLVALPGQARPVDRGRRPRRPGRVPAARRGRPWSCRDGGSSDRPDAGRGARRHDLRYPSRADPRVSCMQHAIAQSARRSRPDPAGADAREPPGATDLNRDLVVAVLDVVTAASAAGTARWPRSTRVRSPCCPAPRVRRGARQRPGPARLPRRLDGEPSPAFAGVGRLRDPPYRPGGRAGRPHRRVRGLVATSSRSRSPTARTRSPAPPSVERRRSHHPHPPRPPPRRRPGEPVSTPQTPYETPDDATDEQIAASRRHLRLILGALMLTMLLAALDQTIVSTALPTITSDLGGLQELSWVVTAYLLASHREHADLGQGLGPARPQAHAADGRGRLRRRVAARRAVAEHGAADRHPRHPGPRRRRPHGPRPGRDRRHHPAARARPVRGSLRRRLRSLQRHRPAARRLLHRAAVVALDLLHQPAARHRGLPHPRRRPAPAEPAPEEAHRLARRRPPRRSASSCSCWSRSGAATSTTGCPPRSSAWPVGGLIALVLFVLQELRTPEPIISMGLFRSRVFRVTSAIGFIVGFAMFGSIIYLSVYLQVVMGATPTQSGLMLLPLMFGLLVTSIVSGRLITRWGRYKIFPIIGTALAARRPASCSPASASMPRTRRSPSACSCSARASGNVMQVLVLAVQNTIDPEQMGAATSASTFFRSIGGSFGTAAFGAIWAARLVGRARSRRSRGHVDAGHRPRDGCRCRTSRRCRRQAQEIVLGAFAHAMDTTFLIAVPIMLVAFAAVAATARGAGCAGPRTPSTFSPTTPPCRCPRWTDPRPPGLSGRPRCDDHAYMPEGPPRMDQGP